METVAIVLAIVVAVALGAWFLFGRKPPEALPKEASKPEAKREPEAAKRSTRAEAKSTEPETAPKKSAQAAPSQAAEPAPQPTKKPGKKEETSTEEISMEAAVEEAAPAKVEAVVARQAVAVKVQAAPSTSDADAKERVAVLRKGLATTRGGFIARLAQIFGRKKEIDPALLDEMQAVLITADIGPRTSDRLLARLRERLDRSELRDEDAVWTALQQEGKAILGARAGGIRLGANGAPTVILVIGVNGVGKTTTIGKLASHFKAEGKSVVLAAGDTFRAAAVLQLEVWAKRVGCDLVKGKDRADPGSVIFDAIKKAKTDGLDVVIADTAGRLHTKSNLMEELKKVVRTAEKALERPVDEVLLVLDATTGQNAIQQAQLFKEAIAVNGIVLTKLDGTAKGGVVLGIVDEHHLPVRYVGIGERVEDLREFDPESFVSALFEKPEPEATVQA
jgi:fused signal recognition particle receptor